MRVGIATDHGGFTLKEELLHRLRAAGHEVMDFGAYDLDPADDYPDFVVPLSRAVVAGTIKRGVAVCGSGVGASVCANKVPGIRAGLVHDPFRPGKGSRTTTRTLYVWGAEPSGRSWPGISSKPFSGPSSVKRSVICVAWEKWRPLSRK